MCEKRLQLILDNWLNIHRSEDGVKSEREKYVIKTMYNPDQWHIRNKTFANSVYVSNLQRYIKVYVILK